MIVKGMNLKHTFTANTSVTLGKLFTLPCLHFPTCKVEAPVVLTPYDVHKMLVPGTRT